MEYPTPTPGQEGRVLITPESGSPYYAKIQMADNPTNPGTALNKQNLLQDRTEQALFGSADNRTVDQAFYDLSIVIQLIKENSAVVNVTLKDDAGLPVEGAVVNGMLTAEGDTAVTDENGAVSGIVAEGTATLSVSGYIDLNDVTDTFAVDKGATYNRTLTMARRNFFQIPSSGNYKFSSSISTCEVTCVGAGAGGGRGRLAYSGGRPEYDSGCSGGTGGGMGQTVVSTITPTPNTNYQAIIGAGGYGAESFTKGDIKDGGLYDYPAVSGSAGGTTSFGGVSASGGSPNGGGSCGFANYVKGYTTTIDGNNGASGSTYGNISYTETSLFGGSGGGGSCACGAASSQNTHISSGGSPYGGDGGWSGSGGEDATGPGGGGGGGGSDLSGSGDGNMIAQKGGNGGPGYISCKNYYKEAA